MDNTELRQEASRLSRLAKECSDDRVRNELVTLANSHLASAIEAEQRRDYLPTLARFASWTGVLAMVTIGGLLALAEWYEPQPREIVVTIEPHRPLDHANVPGEPSNPTESSERRIAGADHYHLLSLLKNFPFAR